MTAWRDWRRRQVKEFWSHPFPKEGKGWGTQHVSFKFRGKTGPSTPLPPVATLRMTDVGIIPTLSPTQGDKGRAPAIGATDEELFGRAWRQQAAEFQHGLDAGRSAAPGFVHFGEVLGVAARENHLAEAIAVGASEAVMFHEPLVSVVVEHLRPKVGVVSGGIAAAPNVAEVAGTITRGNVPDEEVRLMQRIGFEGVGIL